MNFKSMKYLLKKRNNLFKSYFLVISIFFSFVQPTLNAQKKDFQNQNLNNSSLNQNLKNKLTINYFKQKGYQDYLLGKGDVLEIKFISSINPNFDSAPNKDNSFSSFSSYPIDGSGKIYLPKLENIYVEGLTIYELQDLLNEAYKGILKKPNILIRIRDYRPIQVFIDGEVENPGLYSLPGVGNYDQKNADKLSFNKSNFQNSIAGTSLVPSSIQAKALSRTFPKIYNIIKLSGGITPYSDLSNIQIIRKNPITKGGGKIKANINFLEVIETGDGSNNIRILDGDAIFIKRTERNITEQVNKAIRTNLNPLYISIEIKGRVDAPGSYFVNRTSALNDAIQIAGNLKVLKGQIKLTSFYPNGKILTRKIRYKSNTARGELNNPYLRNGDIITVEKGGIVKTQEVIGEVTSPFIKVFTTVKFIDAIFD